MLDNTHERRSDPKAIVLNLFDERGFDNGVIQFPLCTDVFICPVDI